MLIVSFFRNLWQGLTRRHRRDKELDKKMAEMQARCEAREEGFRQKIADAHHLLTGTSWHSPDGKEDFVKEVYAGKMPRYLWYALGENKVSDEDYQRIIQIFWGGYPAGIGDYETHHSHFPKVGRCLRIRNPKNFVAEITVAGNTCPLYQTGHREFDGSSGSQPAVLFLKMYNEPT